MAQNDNNAFSLDGAPDTMTDADTQRRKKLSSYNLRGLFAGSGSPDDQSASADLQEQPLNGGAISKTDTQGAGEPSALATERVQRAPAMQEASPLLAPEERLGAAIGEAQRSEEGSYGTLDGGQRQNALKEFFNRGGASAAPSSPTSNDVGGADQTAADLGKARTAFGYATTADKATGGNVDKALTSLFKGNASSSRSEFSTPSSGADQFPGETMGVPSSSRAADIFPGEALGVPSVPAGVEQFPGETMGVPSSTTTGASTGASVLGTGASALGLIASLYSLYQSRGGDLSPSQFVGLIQSSGGLASSLGNLAGVAPGAVNAISAAPGAATSALGAGGAGTGAALSAAGAGLGAVGGTMGIGLALGNAANNFMSDDDRQLGSGVGTLAGLGVGAGVGTLIAPGIGTLIGAGVGAAAGSALGSLFGQNIPHYFSIRAHAGDVGSGAAHSYMKGVIDAGETGNILEVQQALGQRFADGHVGVSLNLPRDVAAAIGISPGAAISDLTPDQFAGLLKAYSERDGVNQNWFVGSGDVPYLSGTKSPSAGQENWIGRTDVQPPAKAIADSVAGVARGAFDQMSKFFKPQLASMPDVAPLHWQDVGNYRLAPELEYQTYNTHTGERNAPPPSWDPITFDQVKAQGAGGMLMGGGTMLTDSGVDTIDPAVFENGVPNPGGGGIGTPWAVPTKPFLGSQADPAALMAAAHTETQQKAAQQAQGLLDLYRQQGIDSAPYMYSQALQDPAARRAYELWSQQNPEAYAALLQQNPTNAYGTYAVPTLMQLFSQRTWSSPGSGGDSGGGVSAP